MQPIKRVTLRKMLDYCTNHLTQEESERFRVRYTTNTSTDYGAVSVINAIIHRYNMLILSEGRTLTVRDFWLDDLGTQRLQTYLFPYFKREHGISFQFEPGSTVLINVSTTGYKEGNDLFWSEASSFEAHDPPVLRHKRKLVRHASH